MNYILQSFFLGAGGIGRYLIFKFINILFDKGYSENIDCYLSKDDTKDKNGFSTPQKNFISGILISVLLILIIEFLEN